MVMVEKPVLLILDDQPMYLRAMSRALQSGYELCLAVTAEEARALMSERIGAVLADVRLSEDNPEDRGGLEFVRWLRENWPRTPAVAMSSLEDAGLADEARSAGATCFLEKPIHLSQLRGVFAGVCGTPGEGGRAETPG
jgi:two-component system response regulator PhcR